jgi:hypothetical protein
MHHLFSALVEVLEVLIGLFIFTFILDKFFGKYFIKIKCPKCSSEKYTELKHEGEPFNRYEDRPSITKHYAKRYDKNGFENTKFEMTGFSSGYEQVVVTRRNVTRWKECNNESCKFQFDIKKGIE